MNSRASSIDLLLLFGICLISPCLSYSEELYSKCSKQFNCGNITNVDYPFWGGDRPYGCGHPGLNLNCESGNNIVTIEIMNVTYRVLDISTNDQILKIAREDYMGGICSSSSQFVNTTLNSTLFEYVVPGYMNLTFLYGCPEIPSITGFKNLLPDCVINGFSYGSVCVSLEDQDCGKCNTSVIIPIPDPPIGLKEFIARPGWDKVFGKGFEVKWKVDSKACSVCTNSLGRCGYDLQLNNATCICRNDQALGLTACPSSPPARASWVASPPPPAGDSSGVNPLVKMAVGISAGMAGIIVAFVVVICWLKRQHISGKTVVLWKKKSKNDKNVEAFIRNNGFLTLKRYSYPAVKKMTKSFKEKLGQGGYGGVYKGKLSDGRLVAVKVLSESKGNGEDFINEVASISRTSHVNIVSLLGFCNEETKRALIYEFMPNGSLDKFIYDKGSSNGDRHLEWKTLYQIAIGIARGLEYLHRGCNARILHFDIKPHNILLDEDFCPKVSDFGLAKLCQRKESIISMSGARGTIGYIAPEVFSRNFGRVSHKSDVYSYGMMVLEMVGGRKNIDPGVSHTSEIYFPHWIYEPLKQGEDLKLHGVVTEEEKEITRKMILVSLWCIQTNPSDRPSMTKVVEMLEGSLQSLHIPPKP